MVINDVEVEIKGWRTDTWGFTYLEVRIEGVNMRHYPQANGVPPTIADPDIDCTEHCLFLEGEPCYIY